MNQALLVGCGNIGFRHLQAMCAMSKPTSITVVEPNAATHERIRGQFAASGSTGHRFALTDRIPSDGARVDLAVVATTATHRRAVVEELLAERQVGVIILEKVLFQTVADLDAVGALLDERRVPAFVNCGRRTFAGYRELRDRLQSPVDVTVTGHRLGLASNAIHFLDLLEYLNNDAVVNVDLAGLMPGSVPGKRAGCIEIFGIIAASTSTGAHLTLASLDTDPVRIDVELMTRDGAVVRIDELARTVSEPGSDAQPFASRQVSETPEIYEDALTTGSCSLTPYRDSARQHRLFITALRDHLGMSNEEDESCPIS